ncbi:hypothetical protein ACH4SP_19895 [Streptomyces sp. NPDC021093]|uniref:hypothetical protein n=1 Tax=Streptomyces sp. NPDC021093 TaxID=3365112 RepID=UPI0037988E05
MGDSGKVLDISTQDLKKAAPAFAKQGQALAEAAATLKRTLDGLGSPWGDDEQGTKFGEAYKPKRTEIERGVAILALGLKSINAAMVDMADGHIDNEKLVEGMFTKVKTPGGKDGNGDGAEGDKGAR